MQPNQLTLDDTNRRTEFNKRKKFHIEKIINPKLREEHEQDGWIWSADLKSGLKMRKAKSHDEILENRIWCILYKLGYPVLNIGRHFKIDIADQKDNVVTKQIDVLAKDSETVLIIECKSCEKATERDLRKDLQDFAAIRKPVSNELRKFFGKDYKPKILWAFATWNVVWRKPDLALAAEHKIAILKDREIRYLEEISSTLREAGRYQFHAEFFKDQKIPELDGKIVPAIMTKLGGHKVYAFCSNPIDLLKISFVNHRDLRDPGGAPAYQRLLKASRLKKISSFLDQGGFFPNSLLVSFHKGVRFDKSEKSFDGSSQIGSLYLPNLYKSCWIIDGQHRLYGCALAADPPPTISVIAFEKIPPLLEANLFRTINSEQQRVQKRLLDELDGELKWDSPLIREQIGAIASRAIDLLNSEVGGPFFDRIAPPGVDAAGDEQNLDLPQIKIGIVQSNLLGTYSKATNSLVPGACTSKTNEDSLHRLVNFLHWYFSAVRSANPERWEQPKGGYLRNNFGVAGHIRLLGEICSYLHKQTNQNPAELEISDLQEQVLPYLESVFRFIKDSNDDTFTAKFKVPFGSGGPSRYYYALCQQVRESYSSFEPPGLSTHIEDISTEVQVESERRMKWIAETVHDFVATTLEENYGENWFQTAINNKEIKKKAFEKMVENPVSEQKDIHIYLDFIQLKVIVEQKENWPLFSKQLNIQLPDEKPGKAKYLDWFDEINKIRRIFAHPYGRSLDERSVQILAHVEAKLRERLPDYV